MIGIRLKGRLGNQMFQYAAARMLAERLDCPLLIAGSTLEWRFGIVGHLLGTDHAEQDSTLQYNGLLHHAFGCGPSF